MNFNQSEMQYNDGKYYQWKAKDDHDNPYYTKGTDYSELNRTEGYEVLYFINHIGRKHWRETPNLTVFKKIEKMIRYDVPKEIKKHASIAKWIIDNWSKV